MPAAPRVAAIAQIVADVLAADARSRPRASAVRILAIDGPSASGKSTLARRIRACVPGTTVIHGDDFVSWTDLETWWPRFEADVLAPLRAGRDARYQVRDWHGDEFGSSLKGWKTARPTPLVVVEGVGVSRAAAQVDYAVWVEAPESVRMERGLARDGADHSGAWRNWLLMEQDFFVRDATMTRADLRVDGAPAIAHDPATHVILLP